jgi:anti-sigma factor RsiW
VSSTTLTCRELVELVTAYLEGVLEPPERARFEQHLAGCDGCDAYVDQMRQTLTALGRLPDESLSPDARDRLLAAFADWQAAR